jgi:hypothetical protein
VNKNAKWISRKQERKPDQVYKWKLLKEKEKKQCCESGSAWIRTDFGGLDPDPDSEQPKRHTRLEKIEKFHVFKC